MKQTRKMLDADADGGLEHFMPMPPLCTSSDAFPGWDALKVSVYRLPPGEATLPAVECPRIVVHLSSRSTHLSRSLAGMLSDAEAGLDAININPAHQAVHWKWDTFIEIVQIQISLDLLSRMQSEYGVDAERIRALDRLNVHDSMVAQIGHELADILEGKHAHVDNAYLDALAGFLVLHISQRYCRSPSETSGGEHIRSVDFRRIVDFIHENLDKDLRLEQISRMAMLSNFYFIRQFKAALGKTPHQYILDCRIDLAKQLLRETTLPLSEISQRCGFSSQSHFTATFHHSTEVPPRAYRQKQAGPKSPN